MNRRKQLVVAVALGGFDDWNQQGDISGQLWNEIHHILTPEHVWGLTNGHVVSAYTKELLLQFVTHIYVISLN